MRGDLGLGLLWLAGAAWLGCGSDGSGVRGDEAAADASMGLGSESGTAEASPDAAGTAGPCAERDSAECEGGGCALARATKLLATESGACLTDLMVEVCRPTGPDCSDS